MTEITTALSESDSALERLDHVLEQLSDADLHRAHRDGGWTVAQVVSHINVCTIMWLGDLQRIAHDPDLDFIYREDVGHDLTGYPPPTIELARGAVASTRRTLATAGGVIPEEVLDRTLTIPDLGTMTVREWTPLIIGHAAGHVEQAFEIMRDRDFAPRGL